MSKDYKEIQQQGKAIMQRYGWTRLWNTNSPRPVPPQAKGLSDQGWLHKEAGVLVFLEEKYGDDKPDEAQLKFWCKILAYASPDIFYAFVEDFSDWQRVAESVR